MSERRRAMVIVARCFGLVRFVDEIEAVQLTEWCVVNDGDDRYRPETPQTLCLPTQRNVFAPSSPISNRYICW